MARNPRWADQDAEDARLHREEAIAFLAAKSNEELDEMASEMDVEIPSAVKNRKSKAEFLFETAKQKGLLEDLSEAVDESKDED